MDKPEKEDIRLDENEPRLYMTYDDIKAKVDGNTINCSMTADLLRPGIDRNGDIWTDQTVSQAPETWANWQAEARAPVYAVYQLFYEWKDGDCPEDPSYKDFWPIQSVIALCDYEKDACNLAELLQKQQDEEMEWLEENLGLEPKEPTEDFFVGLFVP